MKNTIPFTSKSVACFGAAVLCAGFFSGHSLLAGDAQKIVTPPVEEEPVFTNWINMSIGGLIMKGEQAQFQAQHPIRGPIFGGIDDMHLETTLGKAMVTLDGHAIFAENDYKVKLEISLPDVGYISAGYTGFTTYYNGNAGYMPPNAGLPGGLFLGGPEYQLYRGLLWAEIGLRMPNLPELTLRYEHAVRSGQKDSTSWGSTDQTGLLATPTFNSATNNVARKIVPAFRNINEKRDTFIFDGKYTIGKPTAMGSTDIDLGARFDYINNDDSLNFHNLPGAANTVIANNLTNIPTVANDYYMTQQDLQKTALWDGHISTVTHFGEKLWLTLGFSYSALSTNIGGGRIAGPSFGTPYAPVIDNSIYASTAAYIDLGGGSDMGQLVAAANLLWMPIPDLSITPSFRIENAKTTSTSSILTETSQTTTAGTILITPAVKAVAATKTKAAVAAKPAVYNTVVNVPAGTAPSKTIANSSVQLTEVAEGLDIRYTGVKDIVFYAQCDWEQQYENRSDTTPTNSYSYFSYNATTGINTGIPSNRLNLNANNRCLKQKYSLGANWYPLANLNVGLQYYNEIQDITQNISTDDPVRNNQRLANQNWHTNDVNFRVTWRPLSCLTIVSRYDFQNAKVYSQWGNDGSAANAFTAAGGMSSSMTNNMITECVTWTPIDRLYIQANLGYVMNRTTSPASLYTPAILTSNNTYWTASVGAGLAIDNKTQLRADWSYYRANDYVNNSLYGVPYGSGASEFDISATLSRQITRNVGVSVKYYLNRYTDQLSGGNNNYLAQTIVTSMQVKF
ncbi:MAG: hypothetical protein WCS31_17810 [Verrucomicrobiae bacterium]